MNRSIDKFFEKDLVLRIISILVGILIWFIVLDQQNPLSERTLSIPLRTNKEVLADSNISLVSSNIPTTVDIVIKGRKQRLEKVLSNDFYAFLDFSAIEDTDTVEMSLPLPQYTGDQDIIISDINPMVVKIKLERIVRKEFPIDIRWTGTLEEGYEVVNVKLNPNTVILQELESVMNSVKNVMVTLEKEQLLKEGSINKRIEVYNDNDKIVSSLDGSVQVNIVYDLVKDVPILTTVTGEPNKDYYLKDYTLSQNSVQIMGDYNLIKDISHIVAEPLDIDKADVSFQRNLRLQLPENVQLYKDSDTITAQVNIERYSKKMISIPNTSITIFGADVSGNIKYRILENEIAFNIKGPAEILDTVDPKLIKGYVNVSEAGEDTATVQVQMSMPSGIYTDETVYVTVQTEIVESEVVDEEISPTLTPAPTPTPIPTQAPTPAPTSETTQPPERENPEKPGNAP
ncbi:MAG: hypothetical protein GX045_02435 [Clostridiaceae bacterium]|nr:hypothetical protein [Clostridiaceae bacterium]